MLPTGSEVYHIDVRLVSIVGKNLHNNAGLVVYNTIKLLYAIMCFSKHVVPSKAVMLETLIFVGLRVASTSADSEEFIKIGASLGLPLLNLSYGKWMGLIGQLEPVSRIIFCSSRLLSTNDWTLLDALCFLLSR